MMPNGNLRFTDFAQIATGIKPVNLASAANNGDWINLKNFHRCAVVVVADDGTAANDLTLTMTQATDNAGAGEKALNFTEIFTKQGSDLEAIATWTKVTQTAANTYTSATNGEEELIYVVDFAAEDLDIANDFDHIQATIAQVGAAKVGTVLMIPYGPKFGVETGVTVID